MEIKVSKGGGAHLFDGPTIWPEESENCPPFTDKDLKMNVSWTA
jgi:hypothetical protein